MRNYKLWTFEEIEFISENYPTRGVKYCAINLNRSEQSIINKACLMKIRQTIFDREKVSRINTERSLQDRKDAIDNQITYITIDSPEKAYSLGFLWGDGNLSTKNNLSYIHLEIASEDFNEIKQTLTSLEVSNKVWKIYTRKRKSSWKETTQAGLHDNKLGQFLYYYDYKEKSGKGADKILKYIDYRFHKFFMRGLLDADGNFFFNQYNGSHRASISSTYDQDWEFLIRYLKSIGITDDINVSRTITKKGHRFSCIAIRKQKFLNKIYDEIYSEYEMDNIGLKRKYSTINKIFTNPKIPK